MPKLIGLTKRFLYKSRRETCGLHRCHHKVRRAFNGQPRPRELPSLPKHLGYDVCGEPRYRKSINRFLVTHAHLDHLPARNGITVMCGEKLVDPLARIYERNEIYVEFQQYDDCLRLKHSFFKLLPDGRMKVDSTDVYGYFLHDLLVVPGVLIPECDNYCELLEEYRLKGLVIILFKQPRDHPVADPRINARDAPDCYFADPSTWKKYRFNVLPKVVPAILDLKESGVNGGFPAHQMDL